MTYPPNSDPAASTAGERSILHPSAPRSGAPRSGAPRGASPRRGSLRVGLVATAVAAASLGSGCYYLSAQEKINEAERAFDEDLQNLGAEQSHPYHYYAAEQYLLRAKRESRSSDFASAREFAIKSLEHVKALQTVIDVEESDDEDDLMGDDMGSGAYDDGSMDDSSWEDY